MKNMKYLLLLIIIFFSCNSNQKYPEYRYYIHPQTNLENVKPFYKEGKNNKAILFIHGWTGSPSHFKELALIMNQKGFTVYNILLTGHGTSLYDMEKATYKDWIKDAEDGYKKLSENYKDISVVGLSMGGLLAIYLASKYKVENVICIAPALITKNKMAYLTPIFMPFLNRFRFRAEREIKEGEALEYLHEYTGSPTKTIPHLIKIGNITKKSLKYVRSPILVIQSEKDEAVDNRVPDIIMKEVLSDKKKVLWLKDSRHISTVDVERYILYEEVIKFLNKE